MSKRQSKQLGMTKEREEALKQVREAKQTGKTRLDQILEVNIFIFLIFFFSFFF